MTKQEYVTSEVAKMVASGYEKEIAETIAETAWNLIKWQYE